MTMMVTVPTVQKKSSALQKVEDGDMVAAGTSISILNTISLVLCILVSGTILGGLK